MRKGKLAALVRFLQVHRCLLSCMRIAKASKLHKKYAYAALCDSFYRYLLLCIKVSFPSNCRCRKWVVNCRNAKLDTIAVETLNRAYYICSDHFEESQYHKEALRPTLLKTAIPTIFNVPNPPQRLANKRKSPSMRQI